MMMSSSRKGPQPMKSVDELMVVTAFKIAGFRADRQPHAVSAFSGIVHLVTLLCRFGKCQSACPSTDTSRAVRNCGMRQHGRTVVQKWALDHCGTHVSFRGRVKAHLDQRIHNFEEVEFFEIGIDRVKSPHPVLPQDCRNVRVGHQNPVNADRFGHLRIVRSE